VHRRRRRRRRRAVLVLAVEALVDTHIARGAVHTPAAAPTVVRPLLFSVRFIRVRLDYNRSGLINIVYKYAQ
jgi:hypothetical protein